MKHDNNFDLLRLVASIQVATWHVAEHLKLPFLDTWAGTLSMQFPGVPVFFGISGFLVTQSYLSDRDPIAYFFRRGLRIYPALWACLALIEAAMWWAGSFPHLQFSASVQFAWHAVLFLAGSDQFANAVAYYPFTAGHFFQHFPSGVLWTITVELQFYLVLPLVLELARASGRASIVVFLIVGAGSIFAASEVEAVASSGYYSAAFDVFRLSVVPQLWIFLVGAMLSFYWRTVSRAFSGRGLHWLVAYFLVGYVIYVSGKGHSVDFQNPSVVNVAKTALMVAVIISLAFTFPNAARVLRGNDISYGTYLYHMPIVWCFVWLGYSGSAWLWFAVLIPTLALAFASWVLIERPSLRLRRTVRKRPRQALQPAMPL